jgi:hypothetical protein
MIGTEVDVRKGVPGISRLTWFWALVFTFFTSGAFALGVALYISIWIRRKRKTGFAIYGYLIVTALTVMELVPDKALSSALPWDAIFTGGAVIWLGSAFILRRELMLYYASPEGGVLEISPWFTALFSVYYLNYCLWVVRDSA